MAGFDPSTYGRFSGDHRGKSISFLHYSKESPYPELRKQLLLGISANALFLSAVFWLWTFLSMAAE